MNELIRIKEEENLSQVSNRQMIFFLRKNFCQNSTLRYFIV